VPSGGGIHPSRPWCTEHLWDEDVKEFQAEFNILVPQILDSSESTDDVEAAFSGFLERKKKMVTEVNQVCYLFMSGTYIQHFAVACFSTRNSALRGRRTATQIVAQCYPMSRLNVSKSTFILSNYIHQQEAYLSNTGFWKYQGPISQNWLCS
jgi:hypothetical protein